MGDPAGVGPELVVKALGGDPAELPDCTPLVIGDAARLRQAAEICGIHVSVESVGSVDSAATAVAGETIACLDLANVGAELPFGRLAPEAGQAAFEYVAKAVELAVAGEIDAICTLPLNKEALHAAGHGYPGHTELLAELTNTAEVSMMLDTGSFRVVHVTTHVGLLDAVELIEPGLVHRTIRRADAALRHAGVEQPRIAVCGINPHAGENGLFGRGEEAEKIAPGIALARRGDFDVVVAMYHDQGHGPVKVLGLENGINITIGLPVVRTSVDHGTAFDIAGTGRAEVGSLLMALRAAVALSGER
jgi:4-phospho-D-threonate 3-dehydrogenase / 4-phospho-D-erythronate 3-dehydrogenase